MQVITDSQAPPNLFFIGLRAPAGGAGPNGTAQRVGVVVLKQTVLSDGTVNHSNPILEKDVPYAGESNNGPFQLESDLVPTKPDLDVIVVRGKNDDNHPYGSAQIDRGAGFGAALPRNYGWQSRVGGPRVNFAGNNLRNFVANGRNLPEQFNNAFFNGDPMPGEARLQAGHGVTFTPSASPPAPAPAGPSGQLRVPPAPTLQFSLNGRPISPAVTVELRVDTVVFDALANTFLVSWRAVFPWEDRLEPSTLNIF